MKIERFLFGMFGGRIGLARTPQLFDLISDENFQFLRDLSAMPVEGYYWLPTEQVIAIPHIVRVTDEDGRQFVQNETFLIPIHDYIQLTKAKILNALPQPQERDALPVCLEPIEIG